MKFIKKNKLLARVSIYYTHEEFGETPNRE